MSTEHEARSQLVHKYLDGLLSEAERTAFDRRLTTDGALAAELEMQRRVDAALRGQFAPPTAIAPPAAQAKRAMGWRARLGAGLAAAAVIGLAGYVAWPAAQQMLGIKSRSGPKPVHFVKIGAGEAYKALVDGGMTPEWVCKDDAEFAATLAKAVGESLVVTAAPGLEVLGWSYNSIQDDKSLGVFSGYTLYLLARAKGEPVVVLIDRTGYDRPLEVDSASGLHLFRREIGGAVMYEISPLDAPAVLDQFAPYEPTP